MVVPGVGANFGWCDFKVGWGLGGTSRFAVGQEQFFDWPECDPFCFDDGECAGGTNHTWFKCDDAWSKFGASNTLMLRVVITPGGAVAPTSLGRVKALYR